MIEFYRYPKEVISAIARQQAVSLEASLQAGDHLPSPKMVGEVIERGYYPWEDGYDEVSKPAFKMRLIEAEKLLKSTKGMGTEPVANLVGSQPVSVTWDLEKHTFRVAAKVARETKKGRLLYSVVRTITFSTHANNPAFIQPNKKTSQLSASSGIAILASLERALQNPIVSFYHDSSPNE